MRDQLLVDAPAGQHVGDRRAPVEHAVDARVLRQVAEAAVAHDLAAGRLDRAAEHPEQARLAGAVAADEADLVPRHDGERGARRRADDHPPPPRAPDLQHGRPSWRGNSESTTPPRRTMGRWNSACRCRSAAVSSVEPRRSAVAWLSSLAPASLPLTIRAPPGARYPGCLFHQTTGLWCPGCGLTSRYVPALARTRRRGARLQPLHPTSCSSPYRRRLVRTGYERRGTCPAPDHPPRPHRNFHQHSPYLRC